MSFILVLRKHLLRMADRLSFLAPALLRVTLGVVFVQSGWGKLNDLERITGFFTELGIPAPGFNAVLASSTEFFGGLLILVGLGSRLVSLPLAFVMVVAIATAKRDELDGVSALLGFQEWSYLVMFLTIALRGAGPLSLDALLSLLFAPPAPVAALPRTLPRVEAPV
jgi:putative oxidoreductase